MWEFISEHFFSSIKASFFWWLLGVAIGIIGLVFLKKQGLLNRRLGFFKFMVATYYVGIPLVLGFSIGTYGIIRNVEQEAVGTANEIIGSMEEVTYPAFHTYLVETVDSLSPNLSKEELINSFVNSQGEEASVMENKVMAVVLDYTLDFAAGKLVSGASAVTGVDGNVLVKTVSAIANGDFETFHSELFTLVNKFVNSIIGKLFVPYYATNFILFLILIGLPAIEMIVSPIRYKKQLSVEGEAESQVEG